MLLELDDAAGALAHAERAQALDGESPRVTEVRARAKRAAGAPPEPAEEGWTAKLRGLLTRWTRG